MTYFQGRLINHVHLRVSNIERSKHFYRAVAEALELASEAGETDAAFFLDELYIDQADDYTSKIHIAFQAPSKQAVDRFHTLAIAAGGSDNGPPGHRDYHTHYYAAFVRDPDGNNIEAICEEPTTRSAEAVRIDRADPKTNP